MIFKYPSGIKIIFDFYFKNVQRENISLFATLNKELGVDSD